MNVRKLLDIRRLFIFLHRWIGIVAGLLFIPWFVSGIVFTYRDMPRFGNEERLSHLAAIDVSTLRVEPMDAARKLKIKPNRLRIGTSFDNRPVYRFQGASAVYADTGEPVPGKDEGAALDLVRKLEPQHAATVQYSALMDDIDLWTAGGGGGGGVGSQRPLHTWIFSGGLAYSYYRGPSIDPTAEQRAVTSGGPIQFDKVHLEDIRKGIAVIASSLQPKEVDVLQFRGRLYLLANDGPGDRTLIGATDRDSSYRPPDYRMVWLDQPDHGTFMKFNDESMMDIAREAMPNVAIAEATWMTEYDNYYRSRPKSQPLPVLRVRYADETGTWLYLDPHRGSIALRSQKHNRVRRWLYNGLHKFDFPFVYDRRLLWQMSIVVLSIGGLVLSATTLMPAFRRLRRHAKRAMRWIGSPARSEALMEKTPR